MTEKPKKYATLEVYLGDENTNGKVDLNVHAAIGEFVLINKSKDIDARLGLTVVGLVTSVAARARKLFD